MTSSLPAVSAANLQGARDYEIDIEISERMLGNTGSHYGMLPVSSSRESRVARWHDSR